MEYHYLVDWRKIEQLCTKTGGHNYVNCVALDSSTYYRVCSICFYAENKILKIGWSPDLTESSFRRRKYEMISELKTAQIRRRTR